MRTRLTLLLVSAALLLPANQQQSRVAAIRAMQVAEDARLRDSASLKPLRDGLRSTDTSLQILALRGLGRQDLPDLLPELIPSLNSRSAAVRAEAANALAQSATGTGLPAPSRAAASMQAFGAMRDLATRETDARVVTALVRSLSRLQLTQPEQVQFTESLAMKLLSTHSDSSMAFAALLSLERLARLHGRMNPISEQTIQNMRFLALGRSYSTTAVSPTASNRRTAFMILAAAQRLDAEILTQTVTDADPQLRRLTALALATSQSPEQRERMLHLLLADREQIVRVEVVRGWLRRGMATECLPVLRAINDSAANVALSAIDILAQATTGCPASERDSIVAVLTNFAGALRTSGSDAATPAGRIAMHKGSHALVSLVTLSPTVARSLIPAGVRHSSWVARMYSARAAGTLRDTLSLIAVASDTNANVRAAAIEALRRTVGHAADSLYLRGLQHSDYSVVRVAAAALAQSPDKAGNTRALFAALARITRETRETSRDARVAVLARISELGTAADSAALTAYLRDYDPVVADSSARILSRWTARPFVAAPVRVAAADKPPADNPVAPGSRLRFTMSRASGSATFDVELWPETAPYTIARVTRLARAGHYNGLTFHRVVPNFVVQGGSPGANEYVGDGPFMRDEIWMNSHERGTLGISTRGRDTGDAQLFVNTVDNPRLDFDYTVFGRVRTGLAVVDGILEGDVIMRVDVIGPP